MAYAWGHTAAKCGAACKVPTMRARWGCDRPAPASDGYSVPCASCDGKTRACPVCRGTGQERIDRCPSWHMSRRGVSATIRAFTWLKRWGSLPVAGGMMEQARCFVEAVEVLSAATSRHMEREAASRAR